MIIYEDPADCYHYEQKRIPAILILVTKYNLGTAVLNESKHNMTYNLEIQYPSSFNLLGKGIFSMKEELLLLKRYKSSLKSRKR